MGSICSCLHLDGLEEYIHSDASMHRHCSCLRCLAQQLVHMYTVLSQREEVPAVPFVEQGMDFSTSIIDNSISESDTYRSPPRPLPYDDPRCSQMQHDRLISRRDESFRHFSEENEPLRESNSAISMEMSTTMKCSDSSYEVASKFCCTKASLKNTSAEDQNGVTYTFHSYEDEDECPTCLEEYTFENPRIVMKCSHHFHLSCIYEWKERSELCPVCGKVMEFDETW